MKEGEREKRNRDRGINHGIVPSRFLAWGWLKNGYGEILVFLSPVRLVTIVWFFIYSCPLVDVLFVSIWSQRVSFCNLLLADLPMAFGLFLCRTEFSYSLYLAKKLVLQFMVWDLMSVNPKAYMHLWNPGGPNWLKELQLFHEEEDNSWNLVSRKKSIFPFICRGGSVFYPYWG